MDAALQPLSGHEVLLLLLQLAALLTTARLCGELVRRLGLPTVVGELAAGIVLGPTVFGHFLPHQFALLFPPVAAQFHLIEVMSWLGMVLLLLLTGVETDLRLLRHLGRTAIIASIFGMAVPFVFGFALGELMPARFVAAPEHRTLFALFLATALSISAMPVIAKILLDLGLTRRNLGVIILSAGVVDDTTGWLLLSMIAGAVTGGANLRRLAWTIGGTALFLLAAGLLLYPLLRWLFRIATRNFLSAETDLVLMVVVALLCAAVTDALGVHAAFGAFVAGCIIRQVPHRRVETMHKLESLTSALLAPVFFGLVGLKVDLWRLGDGRMLALVLGVATAGKLVGCVTGSLIGGLSVWESLSIAVAMNARGAMELVAATIGLSLGILTPEMYSIIVVVAIVTSFMAPVLLRLLVRRVRLTKEEEERIAADEARGIFDPATLRVLVPTAGGPSARAAARIALYLARSSEHRVRVLHVDPVTGVFEGLWRRLIPSRKRRAVDVQMDAIQDFAEEHALPEPETHHGVGRDVARLIRHEADKGCDLLLVGASDRRDNLRGEMLERVFKDTPCHIALVKQRGTDGAPFHRLLVPIDGSVLSRAAVEFAIRYAEGVGDGAEVTVAYVMQDNRDAAGLTPELVDSQHALVGSLSAEGGLEKLSPVFKTTKVKPKVIVKPPDPGGHPLVEEARSGEYDLLVLGAENRALYRSVFFGHLTEQLIEGSGISVVLVVPRLG